MATNWRVVARRYARRHGINPTYFERQIGAESNFDPNARSPAGATGIAQIMPETARGWGVDPNNPRAALNAAARNMSKYLKSYGGDWRRALAAYNAGPGAVQRFGGVPPYAETQNYIKKILAGGNPTASVPTGAGERGSRAPQESQNNRPDFLSVIERLNTAAKPIGQDSPSVLDRFGNPNPLKDPAGSNLALFQQLLERREANQPQQPAQGVDVSRGDDVQVEGGRKDNKGLKPAGGWGGTSGPLNFILDQLGEKAGSRKRSGVPTGSSTGSDHHTSQKEADAADIGGSEERRRRAVARLNEVLGINHQFGGPDTNVVVNGIRYQIISRLHGTGPHLHIGARRVRRR